MEHAKYPLNCINGMSLRRSSGKNVRAASVRGPGSTDQSEWNDETAREEQDRRHRYRGLRDQPLTPIVVGTGRRSVLYGLVDVGPQCVEGEA